MKKINFPGTAPEAYDKIKNYLVNHSDSSLFSLESIRWDPSTFTCSMNVKGFEASIRCNPTTSETEVVFELKAGLLLRPLIPKVEAAVLEHLQKALSS